MRHYTLRLALPMLSLTACLARADVPRGVDLGSLQGWDIVTADDAIPSEAYAAEEFQSHVARATGVDLPIVKTTDRPDRHVFIGPGKLMRSSAAGFTVDGFGPEDLRIVIRNDNIVIAGGRHRGTLYGVYTFLEDYLGVRFLTADHTHVPPVGAYHVVGPVDRFYHPPLGFRYTYYTEMHRDQAFSVRLRNNALRREPRFGRRSSQQVINHSFYYQIPSSKYGKEHPEYYALRDGKRLAPFEHDGHATQPCLTNPDVLRIVTDAVLAKLDADPAMKCISVSQNDNNNYCQCPNCAAIDQGEESAMGSVLTFVNAVADVVAERHPDVEVGTLSYHYSRKPPKTLKPRPNVQIQLCSIECCQIHPIADPDCPRNTPFCRDMDEWGKICDRIFIWSYYTNFRDYLLPCPNLRIIDPNVKYFVAHNARGVFMQAAGNTAGGELSDLRNYIINNLIWDPSRDGERLREEFIDLHYGRAASPIRDFIRRVHDRAEASGKHERCRGYLGDYGLDQTDAEAGLEAFAKALELADSGAVRARVEKASICAYKAALEPAWYPKKMPLRPEVIKRSRPLAKRFFELCEKYRVSRPRENEEDTAGARKRLKAAFGIPEGEPF